MTHALMTKSLPVPVAAGSIDTYISEVYKVPILKPELEQELARMYQEDGDLDAARTLVLSNLRFVVHVARGYAGYGLPLADLIQEGNIGLMKAVKRFDPVRGVRLVSFAVHWIRAEMHEFILRNWRIVKVATTKAQRKLFFNLRKSKKRLGWLNQDEVKRMAKDLDVKPEVVMEMESRLSGHDIGFDLSQDSDDEGYTPVSPAAYLEHPAAMDPGETLEVEVQENHENHRLREEMAKLDERSRDILQSRWLNDDKATLQYLADRYGVSAERIRQIEKVAMTQLRDSLGELDIT